MTFKYILELYLGLLQFSNRQLVPVANSWTSFEVTNLKKNDKESYNSQNASKAKVQSDCPIRYA